MNLEDPDRGAQFLIEEHGEDAAIALAITRVVLMQAARDERAKGLWLRILKTLLDLRTSKPSGDQVVH